MNSVTSASNLLFFKCEKYIYNNNHTFDVSNIPRPHFCMALILEGEGIFKVTGEKETINVIPGDIIFVPIASRYISEWSANPICSYISMHFIFDFPGFFSRQKNFKLQKITASDFDEAKNIFEYVLENYNKHEESVQLKVLSKFYEILSEILPKLKIKKEKPLDLRINKAIEYIEQNYTENTPIALLAGISNMSVSRFFPCFKKNTGITPIEYLNHYRINRAIILLMNDNDLSIENISETVGFESSAYFRRVFKKVTGKTPREYRKTMLEI